MMITADDNDIILAVINNHFGFFQAGSEFSCCLGDHRLSRAHRYIYRMCV